MMTEFGGAVAVPSAVRNSDSTTTIRVNDVIMMRIDGAIDSTVKSAISWIARSVTPPLPWPRLMLMSCANAGSASDPAAIRVAIYKTLRGNAAGLTKGSLGGPTMTPFRLRDSQNRSFAKAQFRAAPSTARCEVVRHGSAAPAPPAGHRPVARRRRRPAGAVRLQGVAPFRRDFGPRPTGPGMAGTSEAGAGAARRIVRARGPGGALALRSDVAVPVLAAPFALVPEPTTVCGRGDARVPTHCVGH